VNFTAQAYADDVIFISKEPKGIKPMPKVLEKSVEWSRMEVNRKKSMAASCLFDASRHRCSLVENLNFKGQDIPNLILDQSLKYSGTTVTPRRNLKLQALSVKLTDMKIRSMKIIGSTLLMVPKIDANKTFILPSLDFAMLNGDLGDKELIAVDTYIRGLVDESLKVGGLPVECHDTPWPKRRLSYPSLVDRRKLLMIRSFTQMTSLKDEKVREAMRWFGQTKEIADAFQKMKNPIS
jgi:hypothetical protein